MSNGKRLNLAPCYWIFVSTKEPELEKEVKWSDFKSRLPDGILRMSYAAGNLMSGAPNVPSASGELTAELEALKLENVYLGMRTVREANPWVTQATLGALKALEDLRVGWPRDGKRPIDNRTLIAHLRSLHLPGDTLRRADLGGSWLNDWSDPGASCKDDQCLIGIRATPREVP